LLGAVALSIVVDDFAKVAIRGPCEIHMVEGYIPTEHGKRVACWSDFPL
jgi:hypothetical protein